MVNGWEKVAQTRTLLQPIDGDSKSAGQIKPNLNAVP